jgi:CPA2 family monovalent cation:H+ antiporter-2
VRQQIPAVSSIVSAADDQEISSLARAGASSVFPENVAAGLALADQAIAQRAHLKAKRQL